MKQMQLVLTGILAASLQLAVTEASAVVIQNGRPKAAAADLALFDKARAYLESQFRDCKRCQFVIVIQNGRARISGVAPAGSRSQLQKLMQAVPEMKALNLDGVRFDPQPHPRP